MAGMVVTGLLTTGSAEAQKGEPNANMQNFTADEQRAVIQGGRSAANALMLAEAPAAAPQDAKTAASPADAGGWSVPAAIWLAAAGLAGMGLLQRRNKLDKDL